MMSKEKALSGGPDPVTFTSPAEADRYFEKKDRELALAEAPIVSALAEVGENVSSVFDFVNTARPYPAALPVLIDHLQRGGYPPRIMEGIGRALAVKPAVEWWRILVDRYLNARDDGERTGAGIALAACVTKREFDEFVELARRDIDDPRNTRALFLRSLVRVDRERGWEVVKSLEDDPVCGVQARRMLEQKRRRDAQARD